MSYIVLFLTCPFTLYLFYSNVFELQFLQPLNTNDIICVNAYGSLVCCL